MYTYTYWIQTLNMYGMYGYTVHGVHHCVFYCIGPNELMWSWRCFINSDIVSNNVKRWKLMGRNVKNFYSIRMDPESRVLHFQLADLKYDVHEERKENWMIPKKKELHYWAFHHVNNLLIIGFWSKTKI